MENMNSLGPSSFFASSFFLLATLGITVYAGVYGQRTVTTFFGFTFVLALISSVWGKFALRHVAHTLELPPGGIFPGQSISFVHTVRNKKLLPLLWLEVLLPCDPSGCVTPPAEDIVELKDYDEKTTQYRTDYYCLCSFSMIKWHEQIGFSVEWNSARRGIFIIEPAVLRSGDGFGLSVASQSQPRGGRSRLVVYPALVQVSIGRILADTWDSLSSAYGYIEDTTLIKGVRNYTAGDSAHRINYRLLARGQGLKVNQFEVVSPDSALFCFDAASFDSPEDFEEAISIVASLIVNIAKRGIGIGLVTPKSPFFPQTTVTPAHDDASVAQMLELLSGLALRKCAPLGSDELRGLDVIGQVYLVAHRPEAISSPGVLEDISPRKLRLLVLEQGENRFDHLKSILLRSFRRDFV